MTPVRTCRSLLLGGLTLSTLLGGPTTAALAAINPNANAFRLRGVLEAVTAEDHQQPQVVLQTWVKGGSQADFAGYPGLAAATAVAIDQALAPALRALGGESRVSVGRDATVFTSVLPARQFAAGLVATGQALSHPNFAAGQLAPVIAELAKRAPDAERPGLAALLGALYGPAYAHAPTGQPESRVAFSAPDLQAFYDRTYLPATTHVIVTGDFKTGPTVGRVLDAYAGLLKHVAPAGPLPAKPLAAPAPARWTGPQARLVAGARGPGFDDEREQATMAVLAHILRKRLAAARGVLAPGSQPQVDWQRPDCPTTLLVTIDANGRGTTGAEGLLRDAVAELRTRLISLDEQARALGALTGEYERETGSLEGQAHELGVATALDGDFHRALIVADLVQQVGRQDVMALAQKYLPNEALKTVSLVP